MQQEKKILVIKKKPQPDAKAMETQAALAAFLKDTTRFDHSARYGRYGN